MSYVGYLLFALAIAFMVYATISYQRSIKTSGLPGSRSFFMGKPMWIEGKTFRLWSLFGINLVVGLGILFGTIKPTGRVAHPEWNLIAYSILGPLLHWLTLSGLYRWSIRQKP